MLDDYPGMSCGVWQHRPREHWIRAGEVDATSSSIRDPAELLTHETGQRALVGGIKLARKLLSTPELSHFVTTRRSGDGIRTDDEIMHWARQVQRHRLAP